MSKERDLIRGEREERDTRAEDGRRLEERIAELNKIQNMMYANPLDVPKHIVPYGWEYGWKRVYVRDELDQGNWSDAQRRGWTPVPADRHPDLFFNKGVHMYEAFKGCIFFKGVILCERPTVFGEEDRRKAAENEWKQMYDLPALRNMLGEPTMPARIIENQTRWEGAGAPQRGQASFGG